jgi:hypothetical protein
LPNSFHSSIACSDERLTIFCLSSDPDESVSLILDFQVDGLVMGPNAGRASVFLDELKIAECFYQSCRLKLPIADCTVDPCFLSHDLSIRLFATEPTLRYEETSFLGTHTDIYLQFAPKYLNGTMSPSTLVRGNESFAADICLADRNVEVQSDTVLQENIAVGGGAGPASAAAAMPVGGEWMENEPERISEEGESSSAQHAFIRHLLQTHIDIEEILEIGFHAGGSARAFLSARGDVRVTSVDIGRHGHEEAFWHHTRRLFPGRHTLLIGRSYAASYFLQSRINHHSF